MASLFERNGIWWIQYYERGRRVRRSLNTTSKAKARREKIALEAKLIEPKRYAKSERNATVEEFWPEYLSWAREHLAASTVELQSATGDISPITAGRSAWAM